MIPNTGVTQLSEAKQAVIQRALGAGWEDLGEVVRRHYAIGPDRAEERIMSGRMSVWFPWRAYPLLMLGRLAGALVSRRGHDVPVRVVNRSQLSDPSMYWRRRFHFPGKPPLVFASRMVFVGGDEIVEYVRFGLGVRMGIDTEDSALVFRSRGYRWTLGRWHLDLPDWLFLGHAEIREMPLDAQHFRVEFRMRHPLLGETFRYEGRFRLDDGEGSDRVGAA